MDDLRKAMEDEDGQYLLLMANLRLALEKNLMRERRKKKDIRKKKELRKMLLLMKAI